MSYKCISLDEARMLLDNPDTVIVDIRDSQSYEDGNIPEKYFWRDMLHMNRSGYDVWAKNIKPLINKILE